MYIQLVADEERCVRRGMPVIGRDNGSVAQIKTMQDNPGGPMDSVHSFIYLFNYFYISLFIYLFIYWCLTLEYFTYACTAAASITVGGIRPCPGVTHDHPQAAETFPRTPGVYTYPKQVISNHTRWSTTTLKQRHLDSYLFLIYHHRTGDVIKKKVNEPLFI